MFGPVDTPTEDKLARALESIEPDEYVAMRCIPPPEIPVARGEGREERWKSDIRIFVMNSRLVFSGGRAYLGDYTNQVPCRGFAPLFFTG